jgi:nicotinamidase-related amidase
VVIVVDMQNDFVREGAPIEIRAARGVVPTIRRILDAARASCTTVVYTRAVLGPQTPMIGMWHSECMEPVCACWGGVKRRYADRRELLDCADVIDELSPQADDLVVDKEGYNPYHRTPLSRMLADRAVTSAVIVGTVTELCVAETARATYHEAIVPLVVRDAVASDDEVLHSATLDLLGRHFARVITAEACLVAWAGLRDGPRDGGSPSPGLSPSVT